MGQLIEEVKIWHTPLIGAFLLWRFTQGYTNAHPHGDAPIGILHFLAAGILTSEKLMKTVSNKRANLQSYIRGFEDEKDSDILLTIQDRVKEKFRYTLDSIDIAVAEGLLVWDTNTGKIYAKTLTKTPRRGNNLRDFHNRNGAKAEVLGKWFSEHDIATISSYLKVVL